MPKVDTRALEEAAVRLESALRFPKEISVTEAMLAYAMSAPPSLVRALVEENFRLRAALQRIADEGPPKQYEDVARAALAA